MSSNGFVEYITDLLSSYGDITSRRMFGGYGIYCNKIIFSIIADDELYFKADKELAKEYQSAGSRPFTYQKDEKRVALSYWYVPIDIIEDEDNLKNWFVKSLAVARLTKMNKRS